MDIVILVSIYPFENIYYDEIDVNCMSLIIVTIADI